MKPFQLIRWIAAPNNLYNVYPAARTPSLPLSFRDFDASLYLCEEAFGVLPLDTFERLAGTVLLYPYLCTLSVLFILLLLVALSNLR